MYKLFRETREHIINETYVITAIDRAILHSALYCETDMYRYMRLRTIT